MSSLYQLYKHKDKNGTGTVVNKTYTVPLSELYVEPGLNIREIDQDHVAEFRDAFIAGESVPPLDVQVTEKGVKFIYGHHRYSAAIDSTKPAAYIIRVHLKNCVG
ncbi:DNA-binding protein, partial [Klebsiella pneumoniae]|nr:DNA-binding protein [Klebsiella pneumoniae]